MRVVQEGDIIYIKNRMTEEKAKIRVKRIFRAVYAVSAILIMLSAIVSRL